MAITVETYAMLLARKAQPGAFAAALRHHGLTQQAWDDAAHAWKAALEDDAAKGRADRLRVFAEAYRAERSSMASPADDLDHTAVVHDVQAISLPFVTSAHADPPAKLHIGPHDDVGATQEVQALDVDQTLPFAGKPTD